MAPADWEPKDPPRAGGPRSQAGLPVQPSSHCPAGCLHHHHRLRHHHIIIVVVRDVDDDAKLASKENRLCWLRLLAAAQELCGRRKNPSRFQSRKSRKREFEAGAVAAPHVPERETIHIRTLSTGKEVASNSNPSGVPIIINFF